MHKLFLFFFIVVFASCTSEQNNGATSTGQLPEASGKKLEDQVNSEIPTNPAKSPMNIGQIEIKIIKNGTLEFEVGDLNCGKRIVDSLLTNRNSYYENEQYDAQYNRNSYVLVIRTPYFQFDSLLFELERGSLALKDKSIQVNDVTEEYNDLTIRLENNLAYLNQYKELLKKSKSIKEILQVQEIIRRIEEEIESKKGRISFLDSRVKYSTLHLTIYELNHKKLAEQSSFWAHLKKAFENGIESFSDVLLGLVSIWPFAIVAILLLFFIRAKNKKRLAI